VQVEGGGTVTEDHARFESGLVVGDPWTDASGAFMHIEEAADSVSGPVEVIEALGPEILSRQGIDLKSRRALGENGSVDGDVALEDEGVGSCLLGRRGIKRDCPGRICCPIPIDGINT